MGVGDQGHAPAAIPPEKTRYQLYKRLGGPQGRYGQVRKISPPPGFDPRIVQPVAQSLYRPSYPVNTTSSLWKVYRLLPTTLIQSGSKVSLPAVDNTFVIFTAVTQLSEGVIHVLVQKHVHAWSFRKNRCQLSKGCSLLMLSRSEATFEPFYMRCFNFSQHNKPAGAVYAGSKTLVFEMDAT